jgi:phage shock protein A
MMRATVSVGPPAANETQTDRIWQRVKAIKNFEVTSGQGNTQEKQMVSEGAVLLLDPKSAAEHLAKGDVEPVKDENGNAEKVYVRPLRDYAQLYRDLNLQIESIVRTTAEVDRQTATVQTAQKKVDTDLALRATEKTALESDKTQYLAEETLITKHATALAQRVAEMKDSVKKLVGSNRQLESELSQIYHQAAERITRESAVAASANSQ